MGEWKEFVRNNSYWVHLKNLEKIHWLKTVSAWKSKESRTIIWEKNKESWATGEKSQWKNGNWITKQKWVSNGFRSQGQRDGAKWEEIINRNVKDEKPAGIVKSINSKPWERKRSSEAKTKGQGRKISLNREEKATLILWFWKIACKMVNLMIIQEHGKIKLYGQIWRKKRNGE